MARGRRRFVCTGILVALTVVAASVVYSLLPSQPLAGSRPTPPDATVGQRNSSGAESPAIDHQVLEDRPDDPNAHYNRGVALQSQGKLTEAIRAYRQALQIKGDHAETHSNLAAALAANDELDGAIDHFRQVVELKPDYAQGHLNLGIALFAQGNSEEAIRHYRRAIELKGDYAKAHNNLAVVLKKTGRRDGMVVGGWV